MIGQALARSLPWFRDEKQDLEPLLRANTAPGAVRSDVQREGNELRAACATAQIPSHEEQEQDVRGKCCELRGACMGIPDELAARMPLAYVHFTHLLVDALLLLAPFALYAKLGAFAIVLNGIIALFYRGLLELSKSFLE